MQQSVHDSGAQNAETDVVAKQHQDELAMLKREHEDLLLLLAEQDKKMHDYRV